MIRTLDYLPKVANDGGPRQTLLFLATKKCVTDFAALSLCKPEYIGVHNKSTTGTTTGLLDNIYVVIHIGEKLDTIYSFIKYNLKNKSIIFFN